MNRILILTALFLVLRKLITLSQPRTFRVRVWLNEGDGTALPIWEKVQI